MSECKSCGAPIVWCETANGKLMPLDAKPERRFVLGDKAGHGDGTRIARSVDAYVSHFVTCPDRDQHRKSR